ncbi:M18 family aminopeptidase [Brachybacterium halotolerans subsp. kimchii]|uniref:M18 family aminopeptidase n=1 Tax=Brachybacterium halotolerans TaxID=2795215 RepID=UPI001E3DC359|nr:M18 family aminopeptidase [Brachybacterium halotolerans]UEJ84181.1 M18 family aminopeptidase [Brachybacterium halotolerans subsp. kimchii]
MTSAPAESAVHPTDEARDFATDLGSFVTASPSSFHAVREAARRLEAAGFTALDETEQWDGDAVRGDRYVLRDGSLIAWSAPAEASEETAFRIVGSHTDSPALKVKPDPQLAAETIAQVGVEVYGGALLNSWLDRELRLAGRLVLRGGREVLVATGPLLRVPQLAVHLDRGVNADGLTLNPQKHMQPILGLGEVDVLGLLAERAGVQRAEILGTDVVTADAQAPGFFGAHEEFLASGRLDNLSSVHAEVEALVRLAGGAGTDADAGAGSGAGAGAGAAEGERPIALMVANDHEEVGSASRSGAAGPFLEDVLVRVHAALDGDEASRRRALAGSMVLSADAGHAAHPNYPERHDPVNRPRLGAGPILKINANQRYATDAVGTAALTEACERAGVPLQAFVSNNAMPCGSTIGPITATRLGMTTIDVGITLLSMHSAREMCAVADPLHLSRACEEFLRG